MSRTRWAAVGIAGAVAAGALGCTAPRPPAEYTVVGSFQGEVGCAADWDPSCAGTGLLPDGDGHAITLDLLPGEHAFKVTRGRTWDENWGADGAPGGDDIALALAGPARVTFRFDPATQRATAEPAELSGPSAPVDADHAPDALRAALTGERFYFVMTDRFANGDPANDTGGIAGDRLAHGFDPTDKGFYHGGDLRGLIENLDYIQGLGTTALWLTPSFVNRPVQGPAGQESAAYHGYWTTDFTRIDPHLGTNEEMRELIDAAHARGMKVFFDIITNHTADVIQPSGSATYVTKDAKPYLDASGQPFDDRDFVGADDFPELDAATSFPVTPTFARPEDATAKTPAWLNDPTMYHNRGDSTFQGESDTYGDFSGLDDLFTERPEVIDGMIDIYAEWMRFGIDGFRIDTVKHVNLGFWQEFGPAMAQAAREAGNDDFFMFGEVYDASSEAMSQYTTAGTLPAALDFGFQANAVQFAEGKPPEYLAGFWGADDLYTDADSNAHQLPTFLGNHDMGRVGHFLDVLSSGDELLNRSKLAHDLMYLTRGQPVVYYGDEQGLLGRGGDKDARQSLFATQVEQYAAEETIAGPSGAVDRYDTNHPLYAHIAALSALRDAHPALSDGAQVVRHADAGAGVLALSRIDADSATEYVVVLNNALAEKSASVPTWSPGIAFEPVHGTDAAPTASADGTLAVTVPPLSAVVLRATAPMPAPDAAPTVTLDLAPGAAVLDRAPLAATVSGDTFTQVTFWQRPLGAPDWTPLGTDDNPDYRVFPSTAGLAPGLIVEYRAVARTHDGQVAGASSWGVVGTP